MDPEEDIPPAPVRYAPQVPQEDDHVNHAPPMGGGGALPDNDVPVFPPPINNNPSFHSNAPSDGSTTVRRSIGGGSYSNVPSPVILCILSAQDSGTFGFIHLATREVFNQAALITYFNSAGRDVLVIPCPDFEGFLAANSLCLCNVSFPSDLPDYILQLGRQILKNNAYSSSNG